MPPLGGTIQIPHRLFKTEGYDHREALFGVPPYGGSIAQNVYYADSDMCDTNVDTHKGYPSRPKGSDGKMEPWPSPYILMLDRGGCTFVKKVSTILGCAVWLESFTPSRFLFIFMLYLYSTYSTSSCRPETPSALVLLV
jgi:hypothetical protein